MIDIHTHIAYEPLFPKYFVNGIAKDLYSGIPKEVRDSIDEKYIRNMVKNVLSDVECNKLLKQMEVAGITKSVLLIPDLFYFNQEDISGEKIEFIHKKYYEILKKNSEKFIVFSGIDPRRGQNGIDIFEKAINEYGFKGLKLYPPCGFECDDKILFPYYDLCNYYKIPVLFHTGPSLRGMKLSSKTFTSMAELAKRYKHVNFILGHAGILYIEEALELAITMKNIYLDISGFQKEINKTDLLEEKFKLLFDKVPEQVLFGSDWPMFNFNVSQKHWIKKLESIKCLSDTDRELLFRDNARRILNI